MADGLEIIARCDALIALLEKDRDEIVGYLEGDLLDAYQSVMELEIEKMQELRKKLFKTVV